MIPMNVKNQGPSMAGTFCHGNLKNGHIMTEFIKYHVLDNVD